MLLRALSRKQVWWARQELEAWISWAQRLRLKPFKRKRSTASIFPAGLA